MINVFLKVLNMSVASGWLILAVILLRSALKKAPKRLIAALWGVVALRLVIPFSFESRLSLVPSAETFSSYNIQYETPVISSGIPAVNNAVNPVLAERFAPDPAAGVNPLYVWTFILSVIWLVGMAAMLLYAAVSYGRVRHSVAEGVPCEDGILICDGVKTPFILGLLKPKIYLPSGMASANMASVIAHEKAHLARRDHWWKPLGFLILSLHWFDPLCWLAYVLLCRDIELACDEKVIGQMDLEGKKRYSTALLECGAGQRLITVCPLAFGEVGVKERVKKVLNYKKPAFWVVALAVIACVVVTLCFATDPVAKADTEPRLTLEDVLALSQKGEELTWSDFEPYQGRDIGSGIHIMRYEIDELFEVWVGGVPETDPYYIKLIVNNEAAERVDIRTGDVSAFIAAHRNDMPKVEGVVEALNNLDYQPYTCDGLPEYQLLAADGTIYSINFSDNWVWRGNSEQAELPAELISRLKEARDAKDGGTWRVHAPQNP